MGGFGREWPKTCNSLCEHLQEKDGKVGKFHQ